MAIKERDKFKLEYSINEFKSEKVEDKDMDLEKAERLLKELITRDSKFFVRFIHDYCTFSNKRYFQY